MKMKKFTALLLAAAMTIAMAVPAAADTYVPSVTAKDAPTITDAEFTSPNGTDLSDYDEKNLIVTPLSEADDDDTDEDISNRLNDAYKTLTEVDSLSDLDVADDLQDVLDEINTANGYSYTLDDLTVRDLFDVTADTVLSAFITDGDSIVITFELDLEDNCLLVMQYSDGSWVVLTSDQYTINGDGTVTVYLTKFGTLAFIVPETADGGSGTTSTGTTTETTASSETTTDETTSPQTGETMNYGLLAMAAVLAVGAAVCFGTGKKRA